MKNQTPLSNKLALSIAGNMGNMVGQLSLQVANLQIENQQKDNLIAELQNQIAALRKEDANGKR